MPDIKPDTKPVTVAANMRQAALMLGVPYVMIRRAKLHQVCMQAFQNSGRVDLDILKPLLEKHKFELVDATDSDTDIAKWKLRQSRADALITEIELDEARKKFLKKEDVVVFLKQIANAQKAMLKTRLVSELPSKLLGLGVTETAVIMEKEVEEICQIFQQQMTKW